MPDKSGYPTKGGSGGKVGGGGATFAPGSGAGGYLPANWGTKVELWTGKLKTAIKGTFQPMPKAK